MLCRDEAKGNALMILFFDTETNGLPSDYKANYTLPGAWPDLLQLAYIVCDDDRNIIEQHSIYIRQPNDFRFDAKAQSVHNITQEQLDAGMDKEAALIAFFQALSKCSEVVAHNLDFDKKVVLANWYQLTMNTPALTIIQTCTMKSDEVIEFMGLKKWPRLSALYKKLFKKDFANAHNALNDVLALKDCYFELKARSIL